MNGIRFKIAAFKAPPLAEYLLMMGVLFACADSLSAEVPPAVLQAEAARVATLDRISQATVAVMAPGGAGGGSGVLISPDGYALSNFHVTSECGLAMKCGLNDGVLYDAVLVGLDPGGDVALIKLLGRTDFPYAEMADSDRVRVGDWCYVIGNPFLLATDFKPTVSYGIVSGVHRYQYPSGTLLEYADCIQADAAINPGNSGGPMFDTEGRVIGINGRGSFEKRGRVNVGVGYAISINQIKYFLGHLKAGRVVDHATLGARVASDSGRVFVEDVLQDSDAYRRGLRYGDEVVAFGGRPIASANALKNVLGIFPKGYRVPLSYRHKATQHDVLVRLEGMHARAEYDEIMEKVIPKVGPAIDLKKAIEGILPGKKDGEPKPAEDQPKPAAATSKILRDGLVARYDTVQQPGRPGAPQKPVQPIPPVVLKHYEARAGFVNYYFNKQERDRVWQNFVARGDYTGLKGAWTITGVLSGGGDFTFEISDAASGVEMPGGKVQVPLSGDLSESLSPPGSGGLLVAMGLWRRLLVRGPADFGDLTYLGTLPLYRESIHNPPTQLNPNSPLADVYTASIGAVDVLFYFDPADGLLARIETFSDPESDPCEVLFENYQEVSGRMWPHRIEARFADAVYNLYMCRTFETREGGEK
jgi:S1-C subfamily serine protease